MKEDIEETPYTPIPQRERTTSKFSRNSLRIDMEINFNELKFEEEIGRGYFGVVYFAKWKNADCVCKKANEENSSQTIEQFLKEASLMQKLRHPNICQLYGICSSPLCIVMELLPEGSVDKLLKDSKVEINAEIAISIAKQAACGMTHLHSENILHCDLSARNLLVRTEATSSGKMKYIVKISDFGMSSHVDPSKNLYDVSGRTSFPVRWCAPEIATEQKVTKASDVWAFGITTWEVLERKFPYFDLSNLDVIRNVAKGLRLERPTRIQFPEELWHLMQWCWAVHPLERPSFQGIYDRLQKIEENLSDSKRSTLLYNCSKCAKSYNIFTDQYCSSCGTKLMK